MLRATNWAQELENCKNWQCFFFARIYTEIDTKFTAIYQTSWRLSGTGNIRKENRSTKWQIIIYVTL